MNPLPSITLLATWMLISWSQPDPGSSRLIQYEAQRGSVVDGWSQAKLYRSPSATDFLVPIVPHEGDTLRAYVSITQTATSPYGSRRGGQAIRIRPVPVDLSLPDSLQAPWSNYKHAAAGCRDTLFTNGRSIAYPVGGVISFACAFGDSDLTARGAPGPIASYEDLIMRGDVRGTLLYQYIGAMFPTPTMPHGYYCMRGVRVPLP